MRRTLAFGLALTFTTPTLAQEAPPAPDNLIARGHYARGAEAYKDNRYEEALHEFQAAHAAEPLPAFDYNIARCYDRLGRKPEALAAYQRFITTVPDDSHAVEVRERLAHLQRELAEQPTPVTTTVALPAPPPPPRANPHRWVAPGIVGGLTLAFAATGAGLLGSSEVTYHNLASSCSPTCAPSSWSNLAAKDHAGEALLGIAAVGLAVDVVLLVRAARRK